MELGALGVLHKGQRYGSTLRRELPTPPRQGASDNRPSMGYGNKGERSVPARPFDDPFVERHQGLLPIWAAATCTDARNAAFTAAAPLNTAATSGSNSTTFVP